MVTIYFNIYIIMRYKIGAPFGFTICLDISPRQGEIDNAISYANREQTFVFIWNKKATDLVDNGICEMAISPNAYHAHENANGYTKVQVSHE